MPALNEMAMKTHFALWILLWGALASCKKEPDPVYIYEVNPVRVTKEGNNKSVPKSTVEFISIAWSDLTGTSITQRQLSQLSLLYLGFGDKRLIEDLLIKNLLNRPSLVSLPSDSTMRADIPGFITSTYLRLYNREPNELEQWTLRQKIENSPALSPITVYYAMMTADEYRYY